MLCKSADFSPRILSLVPFSSTISPRLAHVPKLPKQPPPFPAPDPHIHPRRNSLSKTPSRRFQPLLPSPSAAPAAPPAQRALRWLWQLGRRGVARSYLIE